MKIHVDSPIIQAGTNMQDLQSAVNFSQNLKVLQPTDDELQAHLDFLKLVNKKSDGKCFLVDSYGGWNLTLIGYLLIR